MSDRVVIDALAARFGGTAVAAARVAQEIARDREVLVVTRRGSRVAALLAETPTVGIHWLPQVGRGELALRVGWEATRLAAVAGGDPVLSWSGMLPRPLRGPLVAMHANPVMLASSAPWDRVRRAVARRTARDARAVLVPTQAMVDPVRAVLAVEPRVVPWGIERSLFSSQEPPGEEILCVADVYPHKRHDIVLAAWSRLAEPRPPLRIVGDPAVDAAASAGLRREVQRLGATWEWGLDRRQMAAVYRKARVLIIASERETFCLPVVEAGASGVPAVLRDIPVLRETGGGGAIYVEGDDPEVWAQALRRAISDAEWFAQARAAAVEHASGYSWERTARGIVDVLCA